MNKSFSFNTNTHNFWEIYNIIKKYYPIGLNRKEGQGIYLEYYGLKELSEIIIENIHDKNNFQKRWVNFTEQIGKELNKEIIGTTYGQAPSFSSSIIINKNELENCIQKKELHFSISLIGNFYQIYGLDVTTILNIREKKRYSSTNTITVSPIDEFRESFQFVEQKIQERYPKHRLIPFNYGQMVIDGLQVRYLDDKDCSINKALFHHFLSEENISNFIIGDRYYGSEQWRKDGN